MKPWLRNYALKTEISAKALSFFSNSLLWLFSAASDPHPLFSASAATVVIAFLYLPRNLLLNFFSPVILLALILFVTLLRSASQPRPQPEAYSNQVILQAVTSPEIEEEVFISSKKTVFCEPLVEWGGLGGPLEIIYEEYGEEEESGECSPEYSNLGWRGFEGFCYSDTEVETGESPESLCFRWDDEGEEFIEIALEEDNMFEINLSACR